MAQHLKPIKKPRGLRLLFFPAKKEKKRRISPDSDVVMIPYWYSVEVLSSGPRRALLTSDTCVRHSRTFLNGPTSSLRESSNHVETIKQPQGVGQCSNSPSIHGACPSKHNLGLPEDSTNSESQAGVATIMGRTIGLFRTSRPRGKD